MKRVSMYNSVFFVILLVVLSSCSSMKPSTKLIATWKDRSYDAGYVNSILIVGISKDLTTRKLFEETFSKSFSSAGVTAVSSIDIVSPPKKVDKDTIKSAAKAESMKAVLVTHLEASGKKEVYQPSPTGPSRSNMNFGPYYDSVYYSITQGSAIYKEKEYIKLVTNLYETSTEKLIWTGVSESINPKSTERIIEILVKEVIKDIRKENLIR